MSGLRPSRMSSLTTTNEARTFGQTASSRRLRLATAAGAATRRGRSRAARVRAWHSPGHRI
jgi:hypothetical protein